MRSTLEMMKTIVTGKEKEMDENDLIYIYKDNKAPNLLAYLFVNNYGLINRISNSYYLLDDTDKASFCLQELDKCLLNYNFDNNVKFITYFSKCFKNRLRMETEQIMTNKRKIHLFYDELNEELEANKELSIEDCDTLLDQYDLTESEKEQCKLLNQGYSIKDIAKILNKSLGLIYIRNNNIKSKILNQLENLV